MLLGIVYAVILQIIGLSGFNYWNDCWFGSIIPYLGFGVGIIAAELIIIPVWS